MRLASGLLLCLLCSQAQALRIDTLVVSRNASVYHVTVDALIDAPPARVRAQLLDVRTLPLLDPHLKSARAVEERDGTRVESELEECLFGICRRLLHVQKVNASGTEISAQTLVVPGSSFKSGIARWQLRGEGQGTRLIFTADSEPDLWLPPFIGPRVLMNKLHEKTLSSLQALERLARE